MSLIVATGNLTNPSYARGSEIARMRPPGRVRWLGGSRGTPGQPIGRELLAAQHHARLLRHRGLDHGPAEAPEGKPPFAGLAHDVPDGGDVFSRRELLRDLPKVNSCHGSRVSVPPPERAHWTSRAHNLLPRVVNVIRPDGRGAVARSVVTRAVEVRPIRRAKDRLPGPVSSLGTSSVHVHGRVRSTRLRRPGATRSARACHPNGRHEGGSRPPKSATA